MNKLLLLQLLPLLLSILFLTSCADSSHENSMELVFVVSPDIAYQSAGDVNLTTGNLTNQGLNRSLQMATYLKKVVLNSENPKAIYVLSPMTHLQTVNNYPDMAGLGYIQQFALLNKTTLKVGSSSTYTANSFPINVSYGEGSVPSGVSIPPLTSPNSIGLDFMNQNKNNDTLALNIINANENGFYIFCAPWETISELMKSINSAKGYNLQLPSGYQDSNHLYKLSITRSDSDTSVTFTAYDTLLNPSTTYPQLPSSVASSVCPAIPIEISRKSGLSGVVVPANANKNQTTYIVRHAEAHPDDTVMFEDGNYVAAGQWRALALASTLKNVIQPDMVYSIDPAQWFHTYGEINYSYVRPSLTLWPYAIANNLPYFLASEFQLSADAYKQNPIDVTTAKVTSDYFFTGGKFSNKSILLAWESGHVKAFLNQLIASYGGSSIPQFDVVGPPLGGWPSDDYDTIWRVTLDVSGNLTIDNKLCEGIDTTKLSPSAPIF